ncbi:MAG: hypothetical protein K8S56_10340 [Candidatus Cloacimonetes bacterium]|nr:hypothetical protein [Candidatus Cloacimonadota bacterium]
MAGRYIKDFTIAVIFILIIVYAVRDFYFYRDVEEIPAQSKFSKLGLSEKLMDQIQTIEQSIQDRKQFKFTVVKDPLEQNLIVKTKVDLEKQWILEVESMVRLTATYISDGGEEKKASIAYGGNTTIYTIGEKVKGTEGKQIVEIGREHIALEKGGRKEILKMAPIPPKPVGLSTVRKETTDSDNW